MPLQGSAARSREHLLRSCPSPATSVIGGPSSILSCAAAAVSLPRGASYAVEHVNPWAKTPFVKPITLKPLLRLLGMTTTLAGSLEPTTLSDLHYIQYDPDKEAQYLTAIRELISKDLSEPYSIYVYRYFLYQWADLCYMVRNNTSVFR